MSTGNALTDSLVSQWNQKLTNVGPKAVGINLAVTAIFSCAIIIIFSILRPNNSIVYSPRYKYSPDDKRPPKIAGGFLTWIKPLLTVKEDLMMDKLGLDATAYLRFLRMLRWMFLTVTALCCGVLIPANVIYNLKEVDSGKRNALSMLSIQSVDGPILYAHVAVSYLIHLIVYGFIWFNYKKIVDLRWQYFRSREFQEALFARSIMITRLAKRLQSDQGLQSLIQGLQIPYPTISIHLDRRIDELPEMIEQHSDAVRQLEQVLTTYLKNGTIPEKRPTLTSGSFMGIGGTKHDAIEYLTSRIQRLESRIEATREHVSDGKPQQYGFASFEKVPYAQMIAKKLAHKKFKGARIELAPRPNDLIWKNLVKSNSARRSSALFGGLLLGAVMVLYVAPLIAVSALSNLASLTVYVGFLNDWSNNSPITFSAVAGILPPFLAIILQLILPIIMRALTRFQGATTRTRLDRAVLARYFFFLVIFQFFIFSLLGVFFNLITEIVLEKGHVNVVLRELSALPQKIQSAYVLQGNYWLTWFPTRGFSAIFELAQAVTLLYTWVRAKLFGRTPRQIREWCAPSAYDYSVYSANVCFMALVAFVYAPLVPLVTATAAAAFFASSFVAKYMLLYINVTKVESGGRLWRMLINRLLFSLILMQLFMCLTIGLELRYINAIAAAPPILAVFVFKWYLNHRFGEKFKWYIPSQQETADLRAHQSDERKGRLAKRFGHPSLHQELMTPMVHKKIEPLLAQVYHGRLGVESPILGETKGGQSTIAAGGLTFAAIDSHNLELSRDEYLRQRSDDERWESGSTTSSSALTNQASGQNLLEKGYFDQTRQQYIAQGPGSVVSTPAQTPYGMPRLSSRPVSMASQENLLAQAPMLSHGYYSQYPTASPAVSYQDLPSMMPSRSSVDLSAYTDPRESLRYSSMPQAQYHSEVAQQHARMGSVDSYHSNQYYGSLPSYATEPSYPPSAPNSSRGTPPLPQGAQSPRGGSSASPYASYGQARGEPPTVSPTAQRQASPRMQQEASNMDPRRNPRNSQGSQMSYWTQNQPQNRY